MTPLDEAIILWERLVKTGSHNKFKTVLDLYEEGRLLKEHYDSSCPLCEVYTCDKCPWPGNRDNKTQAQCNSIDSPFNSWKRVYTKDLRTIYAKEVLNLFKSLRK